MLQMLFEAELRSALLDVTAVAAVVCGVLFLADVALSLLARAGHGRRAAAALRRISPPLVRHAAELLVTALLTVGAARPAAASSTPIRDWLRHSTTTTTVPAPTVPSRPSAPTTAAPTPTTSPTRPVAPDRRSAPVPPSPPQRPPAGPATPAPSVPVPPAATPPAAPRATDAGRYVVRAGDCLWRIAAQRLGPGATNQAIDSAWRAIYAANRAAVGDDPNLIHPGLVLTLPPLAAAR